MPTKPGHCPDQLATVRMGPRWLRRPAITWWLYCQTASATIRRAEGSIFANTSMPMRWLQMKPWPRAGSQGWARFTWMPSAAKAAMIFFSASFCAAQQTWLAEWRESPLATSNASFGAHGAGLAISESV